jgi:hypothetical protein
LDIARTLPFGAPWHSEPNAISNAIDDSKFYSRSHDALIAFAMMLAMRSKRTIKREKLARHHQIHNRIVMLSWQHPDTI